MSRVAAEGAAAGTLAALLVGKLNSDGASSSSTPPQLIIPTTGQTEFTLAAKATVNLLVTVNGVSYGRGPDYSVSSANKLLWFGPFALDSTTPLLIYFL